jgi:hypothetical protein
MLARMNQTYNGQYYPLMKWIGFTYPVTLCHT